MDDQILITELMEGKGQLLERWMNESKAMLKLDRERMIETLPIFQLNRDRLLRSINMVERKISEFAESVKSKARDDSWIQSIADLLELHRKKILEVNAIDAKILDLVREAQSKVREEWMKSHLETQTLSRFKSDHFGSSGIELDREV